MVNRIVFLHKKQKAVSFEVDSPRISITPNSQNLEASLKNAGIDYAVVAKGYIVFAGNIWGSDIPLMIGIHFNSLKVEFIELFRPHSYYQSETYDIHTSFAELSKLLRSRYGAPLLVTSKSIGGNPCEQWITPDYIINHYIMDRFGLEEHLHINFYKK